MVQRSSPLQAVCLTGRLESHETVFIQDNELTAIGEPQRRGWAVRQLAEIFAGNDRNGTTTSGFCAGRTMVSGAREPSRRAPGERRAPRRCHEVRGEPNRGREQAIGL